MSDAQYQRIAATLRQQIADGSLPPGAPLPSWRALAVEHGTGQGAVRLAIQLLRTEGLVEGRQRARLTVAHPVPVHTLTHPDAPWPHGQGDSETITTAATADIADRLHLRTGTRVRRRRTEYLDSAGRPSHLVTVWRHRRSPVDATAMTVEISSRQLTPDEALALGLARETSALHLIRTHLASDGRPLDTADLVLPADRWRIRLGTDSLIASAHPSPSD